MFILASRSPRRHELLEQLGLAFRTVAIDVDETPRADEAPEICAERLARDKAVAGYRLVDGEGPVLGADTVVTLDGHLLGKPVDRADALRMLASLSGRSHRVYSGIALATDAGTESRAVRTQVTFRSISGEEAEDYWASGEPEGKAGSYAIQGLGAVFVAHLQGSYSNVVGLPLFETAALLSRAGINPLSARGALEPGRVAGE